MKPKTKSQNKSIKKRSIQQDFGLPTNSFNLLHSPSRQFLPGGKVAPGENVLINSNFRDFSMNDDANVKGHWIFDKTYVREDNNVSLSTNRIGSEQIVYQSDFSTSTDGWQKHYTGVDQEWTLEHNADLKSLHISIQVGGSTSYRPSFYKQGLSLLADVVHLLKMDVIVNSYTGSAPAIVSVLFPGWFDTIPDLTLVTGTNSMVMTTDSSGQYLGFYTNGNVSLYDIDITNITLYELPSNSLQPRYFSQGFVDEYHTAGTGDNKLTNCGAPGTTDWVDSASDGLADDWSQTGVYTISPSIVTGNGFTGNAQRADEDNASNHAIIEHAGIKNLTAGKTYKLSLKYRSNTIFKLNYATGLNALSFSANTGDAIYAEDTFIHDGTHVNMYMGVLGISGGWFEIDEVVFSEAYGESPMYKNGGTLHFNGSSEGLQTVDSGIEFVSDSFTIEARVKMPISTGTNRNIVMNGAGGGAVGWGLRLRTDDYPLLEIYGDAGGRQQFTLVGAATIMQDNDWHTIGVTADEPTGTIIGYMDGDPLYSGVFTSWSGINTYYPLSVGYYNPSNDWFFNGYISEIRYSDIVRTADEMKLSHGAAKGWTTLYNNDTVENDGWAMKITNAGTAGYVRGYWTTPILDPNSLYSFHYTYKTYDADDDGRAYPRLYPSTGYPLTGTDMNRIATDGLWLTRKNYFNCGTDTYFGIYFDVGNNGEQAWIRNIDMKKLRGPINVDYAEDFSKGGRKETALDITNNIFESDVSGYTASPGSIEWVSSWAGETGVLKMTEGTSLGYGTVIGSNNDLDFDAGDIAHVKIRTYFPSSNVDTTSLRFRFGSIEYCDVLPSDTTDEWVDIEWYHDLANDIASEEMRIYSANSTGNLATDLGADVFYISSIEISKVTNMVYGQFREDLHTDGAIHPYMFKYNGSDHYILYDNFNADMHNTSWMAMAWINKSSTDSAQIGTIFGCANTDNRWQIRYDSSPALRVIMNDGTTTESDSYTFSTYDENIFVGFAYDASTETVHFFIDGEFQASRDMSGLSDPVTITQVHIGNYSSEYGKLYIGDAAVILFDGTEGRPDYLPNDYENWIAKFYNATEWKYKD